jgi:hypothetical protein
MKRLALLPLILSLFPYSVLALSARTVSTKQAQGTNTPIITLEVAPGYGLNINLIPTGEVIKEAWIGDPSRITLGFDGYLCQRTGTQQQKCDDEGATVIKLRQIKSIAFPNLLSSSNGGTLLTFITEGIEGRKIYQFQIIPVSGQPKYTLLNIQPDIDKLPIPSVLVRQPPSVNTPTQKTPIQSQRRQPQANVSKPSPNINPIPKPPANVNSQQSAISSKPSPTPATSIPKRPSASANPSSNVTTGKKILVSASIEQANALVRGLVVANQKGQIKPKTKTWNRVQTVIVLLRRGNTKQEAISKAGISLELIDQLLQWGESSTLATVN